MGGYSKVRMIFVMIDKHTIENFLQSRKIDAKLFSVIDIKSFSRFSFKLGPTGKISSFESILREFGLLANAISEPVLFTDFPSGLVNIDVITGELSSLSQSEVLDKNKDELASFKIPLIIGQDYTGFTHTVDLTDLPHMLVGGTTGSGKSVFLHSVINTIISTTSSDRINLLLIDPKKVEFSLYEKNKHLSGPVVSSSENILPSLKSVMDLMNKRFDTLSAAKVRNISEYTGKHRMPYLLVIIDEVQDILGKTNKQNEEIITTLAQKGRAAGIHLILATQHPSREILSPKIKANFPARVGFKTANSLYSRVLLDQSGAEHLLGKGDGIFKRDNLFIRFKAPLPDFGTPDSKKGFWSIFS